MLSTHGERGPRDNSQQHIALRAVCHANVNTIPPRSFLLRLHKPDRQQRQAVSGDGPAASFSNVNVDSGRHGQWRIRGPLRRRVRIFSQAFMESH